MKVTWQTGWYKDEVPVDAIVSAQSPLLRAVLKKSLTNIDYLEEVDH